MENVIRQNCFRSLAACFALILAAQITISAQTNSLVANRQLESWRTFAPPGQNFKISLPAQPVQLDSDDTKTIVVSALNSQFNKTQTQPPFMENFKVYQLETRWAGYGILVLDYKWQNVEYDQATSVLTLSSDKFTEEAALREWLWFEKAKMVSSGVFMSESSGSKDAKFTRARAVVSKNKVVIMYVTTPDLRVAPAALAQIYQAETDKFFNSLQISGDVPQLAKTSQR